MSVRDRMHKIAIKPSHRGLFHKDVGKGEDKPITNTDVQQGLASDDPAVRRRANFARMAKRGFKPLP